MTELSGYVLEPLRAGGEFVLYRGRRPGLAGPVLVLAPAQAQQGSAELRRLQHEYSLANDLDPAWAVRPLAIAQHDGKNVLVLENWPGKPLDSMIGQPLELARFLRIAIALAAALSQVHRTGLIHKDIKPANVLVDDADEIRLTGFGIASRLPREPQPFSPAEVIAGTFAYMAPEQTGRMNRSIDARSDLYSLGVTLYEMVTGTLPFSASDPMEWIHCHMARRPTPPGKRVNGIPPAIESIILKLLAKNAEDRYQTAAGVESDLHRCLTEWETHGRIHPFVPGSSDASDFLLVPEKLYGRDGEIGVLLTAFDKVVTSGMAGFIVVSGYSGIGKSSIVNELHKVLVPSRGLFAAGKFDQYKRDIPYATLAQAFHSLVRQLLNKNDAELKRWRQALLDALGPNGQLMVNLIPELALIIGEQPPVADLTLQDAQNRFYLIFRRFLGVFARPDHPLVLFIDDLQWLDAATLRLLERLALEPDMRHLLVVGAYRDNEVDASHPLMRTLQAIRNAGGRLQEIVLGPLKFDSIRQIVADTLRADPQQVHQLAGLVFEKTRGNPFFTNQFITTLADEGLLVFEPDTLVWRWDINVVRARSITSSVIDLIAEKLSRLSGTTQEALKHLACLGNTAPAATLSTVLGKADEDTHRALWQAVQSGLVSYRDGAFSFLHDRVQEAAYALIPDVEKAQTHLRIGKVLAGRTATEFDDAVFETANQLNRGAILVQSVEEREWLAEINLAAGQRAKASTAYASALNYLAAAEALLTDESWSRCYKLTSEIKLQRASCELLNANFGRAGDLIAELLAQASSKTDKARAYRLQIELHVLKSENARAVDCALDGLRLFGIEMPAHPSRAELEAAYDEVRRKLGGRPIESLVDLPRATDQDFEDAMSILSVMFSPAVFTDENLAGVHLCHMVMLTLERGTTGASTHAFGWFGLMLGHFFGRYAEGYKFGQLARALVVQHGFTAFEAKTLFSLELVTLWTRPVAEALGAIKAAFTAGVESGDVMIACYCCNHVVTDMLVRGDSLDKAWQEAERGIAFARKADFRDVTDIIVAQQRFIQNMRGNTLSFSTFDEADFDERSFESKLTAERMTTMVCWYWIIKGQARYISGDFDVAAEAFERAATQLWASPGHIQNLDYFFFSALTWAALDSALSEDPVASERRLRIQAHHEQLARWAQSCPETFAAKHALVGAELARIQGRALDAENLYEEAIGLAHKYGLVHDEALANELAGRFYAARGFGTVSKAYLGDARACYRRWGAFGKVRQIDVQYPELRPEPPPQPSGSTIATPAEQLDLATVIRLMQAVSSEIDLNKLIDRFMTTAIEHAGGDRALLILSRGEELTIQAEAKIVREKIEVQLRNASVASSELPETIIRHVAETRDRVLLSNAAERSQFSGDPYIDRGHCQSILCLPLIKQGKLIAVLYIENSLTMYAFTPARIGVLTLLASQAAISLENSRLYTELQHTEAYLAEAQRLSRTGSFAFSIATGELLWSDEVFRIYGFDPAKTKLTWELPFQRNHPDEANLIQKIIECVSPDGTHFNIDHRLMMPDGSVKRLHVIAHGERNEAGKARYVGTVMDVTESRQAQERLQVSLAEIQLARLRLEEVQRIAQIGYWQWTLSTNRVLCSEEHCRIFGFTPEELDTTYDKCLRTVHPDDLPALRKNVEAAVSLGKEFATEFRIVRTDGSVRHVQTTGGPSTMTGCDEYVGTTVDITERKRHEEEMQKQVSLIENSTDFIAYSQSSGRVEYLNAAGRRLIGIEPDEDVSKYKISDFRPLEDQQRFMDEVRPVLLRDGHWAGELTLLHFKTGAVIPVFQTIFFINDRGTNRRTGIATICRDISERKRIEENLRTSLEEKDALLKEVHHRVKNNLQLISSLLNLQAGRIADASVADAFLESRNRVRSMALVHENLYRAGNFARVPMAAHIRNLCAQLIRVYSMNNQRIELAADIEEVELDIDRAITTGLIVNELVSNALKHAFPDDRTGLVKVELKSVGHQRYALAVIDDGVGLPATGEADYSSTLGLQLVQDLTRQLHGTITIQRGLGTAFVVKFDAGRDQEPLQ